jgi:tubulin-specific chaperone E
MADITITKGCRVELSGSRGFVRFLGKLPNRGETKWIGVEWDDPARGKHDGTIDAVRHFVSAHPTGGSFVKASKLGTGRRRSLLSAVVARHAADAEDAVALPDTIGGIGGRTHLVGSDVATQRQARVSDATSITLRRMGICDIARGGDDSARLAALLTNVATVNLGENLLTDPSDILFLVSMLTNLLSLDMSQNMFVCDNETSSRLRALTISDSAKLTTLVLNQCRLPWTIVVTLCSFLPTLEQLRLHSTSLTSLNVAPSICNLRLVDLYGNSLSWADLVSAFGQLTMLECLFAGCNSVQQVRVPKGAFPALTTLSLGNNPLGEWRSVSELWQLPNLLSLRLADTPLMGGGALAEGLGGIEAAVSHGEISPRDAVIARLGRLAILDGSTIYADERMYAEKRYLQYCVRLVKSLGLAEVSAEIIDEHPRIHELCVEYDTIISGPMTTENNDSGSVSNPPTLRADLVYCSLINRGGFGKSAGECAIVRLPAGTSVGRVHGVAARRFGASSAADIAWMRLVVDGGVKDEVINMPDETLDLRHYGIDGGQAVCLHVYGPRTREEEWDTNRRSPCAVESVVTQTVKWPRDHT